MFYIVIIILALLLLLFIYLNNRKKYIYQESDFDISICNLSISWTPNIVSYIKDGLNIKSHTQLKIKKLNVYHIMSNTRVKDKINIVISGEPWNLTTVVDLSIGPVFIQENAKYHIYYPQMYSSLAEHRKSIEPSDYISDKIKFCAYMYNKKHDHRKRIFDLISSYKRVDGLGECCKNTSIPTTRHINNENETYNDIAIEMYKDYKFVIAMENEDKDGYFTEKIINPIIANSIPIYWGNKKVFDYINKKRVIYIPDYSDNELIDVIKRIDNDDKEYDRIIKQPIYVSKEKKPENVNKKLKQEIKDIVVVLLQN